MTSRIHLSSRVALLSLGLLALSTGTARAQEDDSIDTNSGRKIIYKQRTEIDFEGVNVDAELVKPQGALLLDRKRASFNPLIKLRSDFNTEMSESVDDIE